MAPTQLETSGETFTLEGLGKNQKLGLGQKGMHTHPHTLLTCIYTVYANVIGHSIVHSALSAEGPLRIQRHSFTTPQEARHSTKDHDREIMILLHPVEATPGLHPRSHFGSSMLHNTISIITMNVIS